MSYTDISGDLERTFAAALSRNPVEAAREEMVAAGWLDALEADEPLAVAIAFRLQGAMRSDVGLLDHVITRRLRKAWPDLPPNIAVAYPAAAGPSSSVTHVVLPGHREVRQLLWIPTLSPEQLEIIEPNAGWDRRRGVGVDPDFDLIGLERPPTGASAPLVGSDLPAAWDAALAAARVAIAHQLVAGSRALLEMALGYARERRQFATPIGAFQAVKHRLADTLVAISASDAATTAAASVGTGTGAVVAKVLAGRAAAVTARNCLQVFGAIGFTVEHDFQAYFRRNLVLTRLLGDPGSLERQLGARLRRQELRSERMIELDQAMSIPLLNDGSLPARGPEQAPNVPLT